jgi:VIT1/CCC1 family predicted Fe2+/Mn2+ transporter
MICPTCGHKFALTWSKYWKSFFDTHACPSCGSRFKVVVSRSYLFLICVLAFIFGGMPAVAVSFMTHSVLFGVAICVTLAIVVVIPFDRWTADKHRPVKPIG